VLGTPSWTTGDTKPVLQEILEKFVGEVINKRGATVSLYLSGDSHHFAHYKEEGGDVHWITAGGGGAFLHPTHHLPKQVMAVSEQGSPTTLERVKVWPERRASWGLLGRVLLFPRYNPSFLLFTAAVHLLLAWAVHFGMRQPGESLVQALRGVGWGEAWSGFVRNPVALILGVLVVLGFTGFAKPPKAGRNIYRSAGALHGALHCLLSLAVVVFTSTALERVQHDVGFTAAFLLIVAGLGGVGSGLWLGSTSSRPTWC